MTEGEFRNLLRRRISQTAIGASAIRNQGAGGMINTLHGYFETQINLDKFFKAIRDKDAFKNFLDKHTTAAMNRFDAAARSWGAARKGLNLFFRDVVYNKFYSDYYRIPVGFAEFNWFVINLEVPLDSTVANGLRCATYGQAPRWRSIKSLTPEKSNIYQEYADMVAEEEGIARINLDLKYWRPSQT